MIHYVFKNTSCKATYKMFRFIKKYFFIGSLFLSNLVSTTSLSCISMNNQACKARPEIINVNSNNPVFYPFSIKTSKCSGNCNNINDPYAKICVPDVVKDLNVKVFNLMSRTNETRHIEWHETLNVSVNVGLMFVIINNAGIKINADANAKNYMIKVYVINDMHGILVTVDVKVINHLILASI